MDDETIETDDTHIEDNTADTGLGASRVSDDDDENDNTDNQNDRQRLVHTSQSRTSSQSFDDLTSAPFASQDPSPNEERILSYDSMFSNRTSDHLPMFISHLQEQPVIQHQPQPQHLFRHPQQLHLDSPFTPGHSSSAEPASDHQSPDTPSSSGPRPQQRLCNSATIAFTPHTQPVDLDNLSGHFTEISLSSPQDSLVDAAAAISLNSDAEEEEVDEHGTQKNTDQSKLLSASDCL